jgi:ABC-type multidrug transport system fused ATPase/permease subunit
MSEEIHEKLHEVIVFSLAIIFFILPAASYFYIVAANTISPRRTAISEPHPSEPKEYSSTRNYGHLPEMPGSVGSSSFHLPIAATRILVESANKIPRLPHSPSFASTAPSSFKIFQEVTPTLVSFSGITYSVPNSRKSISEPYVILNGVSGFMKPGTLCAIMGPSGIYSS